MSTYENPETVIDTQSGQHWRNLQQSLSSSFAGVNQAVIDRNKAEWAKTKENEKEKKEEVKGRVEDIGKQIDSVFTTNKNLAASPDWSELLKNYNELKTKKVSKFKLGQTTDETLDKELQDFENRLVITQGGIATIASFSDQSKKALEIPGEQEGSFYMADPDTKKYVNVFAPVYKGEQGLKFKYNTSDKSAPMLSFGEGDNMITYNAQGLQNGSDQGQSPFIIIPKYSDKVHDIANDNALATMLDINDKGDIKFRPNYYTEKSGPSSQTETDGVVTKQSTTILAVPDEKAIMDNPAFTNIIDATVSGWVNNDTRAATAWYNTYVVPSWNNNPNNKSAQIDIKSSPDTKFTDEEAKKFKEHYSKVFINSIGTKPLESQASGAVQHVELVKTDKKNSGASTVGKPTQWDQHVSKYTALYNKYKGKSFPSNKPLWSVISSNKDTYIIFKNGQWHLMRAKGTTEKGTDLNTLKEASTKKDATIKTFKNTPDGTRDAFSSVGFN